MKKTLLTIFTLIITFISIAQSSNNPNFNFDLNLSEKQMYEDLDSLQSHIKTAGIHSVLNKHLKEIDLDSHFNTYRQSINKHTTTTEFALMVDQLLNLVQDGHANLITSAESIKSVERTVKNKKLVFDTLAFNHAKNYDAFFKTFNPDLKLPIKYIDGKYFITVPFEYNNKVFDAGLELMECNSQPIEKILPTLIAEISPLRWDLKNKKYYEEKFYKAKSFVATGKINLGFKDDAGNIIRQEFKFKDSVTLLKEPLRKIGYFTQNEEQAIYFKKEGILYLRVPKMARNKGAYYSNKIDSIHNLEGEISKIVLDIRGNGGGTDNCYTNILKHIVSEPVNQPYKVAFPKNDFIVSHFNFEPSDNIKVEENPLLGNTPFYIYEVNKTITPDSTSIKFQGNIFVLQDEFIYSSAGNLSALAKSNSNIISIGNITGKACGNQASPIYFSLPNSKLIFRLEPMLDFSDVTKIEDIFHDEVTLYVPQTIEDYKRLLFSEKDIYGMDFLRNDDPLFKAVVDY